MKHGSSWWDVYFCLAIGSNYGGIYYYQKGWGHFFRSDQLINYKERAPGDSIKFIRDCYMRAIEAGVVSGSGDMRLLFDNEDMPNESLYSYFSTTPSDYPSILLLTTQPSLFVKAGQ